MTWQEIYEMLLWSVSTVLAADWWTVGTLLINADVEDYVDDDYDDGKTDDDYMMMISYDDDMIGQLRLLIGELLAHRW